MDSLSLLISNNTIKSMINRLKIRLKQEKNKTNPNQNTIDLLEYDIKVLQDLILFIDNDQKELNGIKNTFQSLYIEYLKLKNELNKSEPKLIDKLETNLRNVKIGNKIFTIYE